MTGATAAPRARLTAVARWTLAANLITNIGNGMHTLALGKLLYDRTGSVAAFGGVIIVEYVVTLLLQMLAGSVVDRGNPKATLVVTDTIRGLFIMVASVAVVSSSPHVYWWVVASVLLINIGKPFYRSSTFTIGPAIAPGDLLIRYNSYYDGFLQVGQLVGAGLAGPIIVYFGPGVAFGLNGLSYLLAAILVLAAHIPLIERKLAGTGKTWSRHFLEDWKDVVTLLRANMGLGFHLVLCAGDYIAVSLINLLLVPLVDHHFGGNPLWLSALDGSFAVGAIAAAPFTARLVERLGVRNLGYLGIGGQAVGFALLAAMFRPLPAMVVMALIGALNTVSVSIYVSSLQRRIQGPIRARIASVRNIATAALAAALIPLVSFSLGLSLTTGLLTASVLCVTFSASAFTLSRRRVLGPSLLGEDG